MVSFNMTVKKVTALPQVGDEDRRMNASPQELQLALGPMHFIMGHVLPIVENALSKAVGNDLQIQV